MAKVFKGVYRGRIGVLMGGPSSEREISLRSGNAICEALRSAQCDVVPIDLATDVEQEVRAVLSEAGIEVAFIALHGRFGEDGTIQRILRAINMPYVGSDEKASRLAMDKVATYRVLRRRGIAVPRHYVVARDKPVAARLVMRRFKGFPLIIKPVAQGSSIGISIAHDSAQLETAMAEAFRFDGRILVEEFIKGREVTVGILDDKPLPVVEIVPKEPFFDYQAKYLSGTTEYIVPARLPQGIYRRVQRLGVLVHKALGCRHFSRVDILVTDAKKPIVLELNSIPGFTSTSLLPKAAAAANIGFSELCLRLVNCAVCKEKSVR